MFSHSLSFLRAFTCFFYILSAINIFGYFPRLFRHTVFCYVLTAAGSQSSFGYYHLSRQQPLLCLSACTSLLLFLFLSVIDDTSFLLHLNFSCSLVYVSFIIDIFFCFTAILHAFFFIYIIYDWYTSFSCLFCHTVFCYVLTAAGSRSSFWILSLIPAAALALLYLHALFFYHLCLMRLFIPYTIYNHLYMMFFLCTCGFPYGSYYQKCYFHHL